MIYVISDSLGETAEMVARAAASQFDGGRSEIRRIPYVNTLEHLEEVLKEAYTERAVVAYTVVMPELKLRLQQLIQEMNLTAVDLLGPIIEALTQHYGLTPKLKPGLLWQLDEQYFRRVEAIEFAVKYDDGKDSRGLPLADIVLVGVSRTSKTPLSMYLAHKRLKVANVPLVPEVPLPKELMEISPKKLVALTINPTSLIAIRKERLKALGLNDNASYASMDRIYKELEYSEGIVKRLGCPVIDVTNKAVEETASRILEIYNKGEH